ncbi:tyrosine-protein phosphatase [Sphingomonas immobilis]|uniref:Tyrosine-protein phosphatase n=1 Tax=Sphingomonas immobilis TaxID=3063997 RepID=A0ABT8ZX65_9SPHN|nr:tyrosine-protein phosphatase [Sphingomonas sp. CA1-15]MDO7842159.1 tyrosine-protein phosphatase [Sphingomonas sp. CA1-15]
MEPAASGFEGIDNFRDFGGQPSRFGGRVASGRLFRSGDLAGASDADLGGLRARDIRLVVDMRYPRERETRPSRRHLPSGLVVLECADLPGGRAPHLPTGAKVSADEAFARMLRVYRGMPFAAHYVDLLRAWFTALAETPRGGALVHCAVGKDRTGMIAGVTLLMLGVEREALIADYMLTGDVRSFPNAHGDLRKERQHLIDGSDPATAMMYAAQADYVAAMLAAIDAEQGGIAGYAQAVLGLDMDVQERIRDNWLQR